MMGAEAIGSETVDRRHPYMAIPTHGPDGEDAVPADQTWAVGIVTLPILRQQRTAGQIRSGQ